MRTLYIILIRHNMPYMAFKKLRQRYANGQTARTHRPWSVVPSYQLRGGKSAARERCSCRISQQQSMTSGSSASLRASTT